MPSTAKPELSSSKSSIKQSAISVAERKLPVSAEKYFTIGKAAKICQVKPHVLRYWEQEFEQLKPTKRRGNRRYYQSRDFEVVELIRVLLHDKGFTIEGARQQLASKSKRTTTTVATVTSDSVDDHYRQAIKETIADLRSILGIRKP